MDSFLYQDLFILLNAFGAGNCFLLAMVFARKYRISNHWHEIWVSALLFVLGIVTLNTIINTTGYVAAFPTFEGYSNAFGYAIAPLLFLMIQSRKHHQNGRGSWVHLWFPVLVVLLTITSSFIESGSWFGRFVALFTQDSLFKIVWNTHFAFYVLLAFRQLPKTYRNNQDKLALTLFWGISVIWFINLLIWGVESLFTLDALFLRLNVTVLFFGLMLYIFYYTLFFPNTRRNQTKNRKGADSALSVNGMDFKSIVAEIRKQKLYRNSDLSVRSISEELGISYTNLSQIINQETGANFNDFINKLRIEDIIVFLKCDAHKDFTMLGLAQKAGFRSASSFYAAFRKVTGTTPSAYLDQMETE